MKAASLSGSRVAELSCRPSGHAAVLAPRDELSRTSVAISSETPSGPEGCAQKQFSAEKFSFAGGVARSPELGRPEPTKPDPAGMGASSGEAGADAFPLAGARLAAGRIDPALGRMIRWLRAPADPPGPPDRLFQSK